MAIDLILSSETGQQLTNVQLDTNLSTIQTAVNTLQTDVAAVAADITVVEGDITTLQSDVADITSAFGTLTPLTPPAYYTQLTLRSQKGSALTNEELDRNFIHLDVRNNDLANQLDTLVEVTIPALSTNNTAALASKQNINAKLTSLSSLATSGILVANSNTIVSRLITSGSAHITVSNGDGLAGNPTLNVGPDVVLAQSTNTLTNKTISGASNTITNVSLVSGVTGILPVTQGGTGSSSASDARTNLQALISPAGSGLVVKNGVDSTTTRQLAVSGVGISISNTDGVAGNPTITSSATSANTPSTIVYRDSFGNIAANVVSATLSGDVLGNAATVTNGLYSSITYNNPTWINSLAGSKVTSIPNTSLVNPGITINGQLIQLGGSITVGYPRQAWVKFQGSTGAVVKSQNVVSVTKTSTGTYSIAITPGTFEDGNMIVIGTASDTDHIVTYLSSTTSTVVITTHDAGINANNGLQDTSGTVHVLMIA